MASVMSAITNTVPITQFNRGLAGKIFEDVKQCGAKVVMKNNTAELLIRRYCSLTIHFILALLYQKEHPAIKVLFRMEHRGFEPLAS